MATSRSLSYSVPQFLLARANAQLQRGVDISIMTRAGTVLFLSATLSFLTAHCFLPPPVLPSLSSARRSSRTDVSGAPLTSMVGRPAGTGTADRCTNARLDSTCSKKLGAGEGWGPSAGRSGQVGEVFCKDDVCVFSANTNVCLSMLGLAHVFSATPALHHRCRNGIVR